MVKVSISEDCGNSPKNLFVQNMSIALVKGDQGFIEENVTEDVRWDILGKAVFEGREKILTAIPVTDLEEVAELRIEHALTHGAAGAVNGVQILHTGRKIAFCNIFTFKSAGKVIVKSIKSYQVEIS